MRIFFSTFSLLLFFVVPAGLFAFETWVPLRPLGGGFSVLMPGALQPSNSGPNQWIFRDPQNRLFSVVLEDKQPGSTKGTNALHEVLTGLLKASNARLVDKKIFGFQHFPAYDFKLLTGTGQVAAYRLVMVNARIYALCAVFSARTFDEQILRKFLDSFQLTSTPANPRK